MAVQRLIHEVPDKASLVFRVFAHQIPILLEATTAVTHGMTVFTLNERLGRSRVRSIAFAPVVRGIHRTHDITRCSAAGLLILHRPYCILSLDPVIGSLEVRTANGLVTHRPDNHTGVVVVHLNVMLVTLQDLLGEERSEGDGLLGIVAKAMTLLIGFRNKVDTILVAEVVPHRIIGVMTGSHGIHIEAFHQLDILNHAFTTYHVAAIGVHLVAIHTFYIYRLSVYQQLGILDLHTAEAHLLGNHLRLCTNLRILTLRIEAHHEGIEIRVLGTPFLWILYCQGCTAFLGFRLLPAAYERGSDLVSFCVIQTHPHITLSKQRHICLQHTITIVVHQIGHNAQVLDMTLRITTIQIAIACHAAQSPEILVLAPGAIAPAEHLEGDEVLTGLHIFCDVELSLDL